MPDVFHGVEIDFNGSKKYPLLTPTNPSHVLYYPPECDIKTCQPYKLTIQRGIYLFECWGAQGSYITSGKPGLGAYTSGVIKVEEEMLFYVYVGATGFFNGLKIVREWWPMGTGCATDVRLNTSQNWYDAPSLASRIMVAAGGASAERIESIGGNGGGLIGGEYTFNNKKKCTGATQTGSSAANCESLSLDGITKFPEAGGFGYAKSADEGADIGGYGGSGYYGGLSFEYAFAGSGGSSFISGYEGCKAIKDPSETDGNIAHKEDSIHYSNIFFTLARMIPGNTTMPLPNGKEGIWDKSNGAFRLTYLSFKSITCKEQSKYLPLSIVQIIVFVS